MAKNLREKVPASDKLVICDRDTHATDNFVREVGASSEGGGNVEVVKTPRKVAEQSVSTASPRHASSKRHSSTRMMSMSYG